MAKILDAVRIHKERFTKWAEEYLSVPEQMYHNGVIMNEDVILCYLIEKGVFNMTDLKSELSQRKIHFYEFGVRKELCRNRKI